MQGREAGVRTAALELHKQSFFGWAGEVASPFEGPVGAPGALILLEDAFISFQVLQLVNNSSTLAGTTVFVAQADLIRYHVRVVLKLLISFIYPPPPTN